MPVGKVVEPARYTMDTLGYDYRFGGLCVRVRNPSGQEVGVFVIPVLDLMRNGYIAGHELRALIKEGEEPPSNLPDHETARRQMIEQADLAGKVVLDVGGYDGSMAKLALDHGAARAICLDSEQYHHYGWQDKKLEGVEYITGDAFEWSEPVDVVILYNILYHVKNPWLLLDHIRGITKEEMLLCTLYRYHDGAWVYLYEPRECNPTDESVFWGPSVPALERLLGQTGWKFEMTGKALDRVCYRCWPTGEQQFRQSRW